VNAHAYVRSSSSLVHISHDSFSKLQTLMDPITSNGMVFLRLVCRLSLPTNRTFSLEGFGEMSGLSDGLGLLGDRRFDIPYGSDSFPPLLASYQRSDFQLFSLTKEGRYDSAPSRLIPKQISSRMYGSIVARPKHLLAHSVEIQL